MYIITYFSQIAAIFCTPFTLGHTHPSPFISPHIHLSYPPFTFYISSPSTIIPTLHLLYLLTFTYHTPPFTLHISSLLPIIHTLHLTYLLTVTYHTPPFMLHISLLLPIILTLHLTYLLTVTYHTHPSPYIYLLTVTYHTHPSPYISPHCYLSYPSFTLHISSLLPIIHHLSCYISRLLHLSYTTLHVTYLLIFTYHTPPFMLHIASPSPIIPTLHLIYLLTGISLSSPVIPTLHITYLLTFTCHTNPSPFYISSSSPIIPTLHLAYLSPSPIIFHPSPFSHHLELIMQMYLFAHLNSNSLHTTLYEVHTGMLEVLVNYYAVPEILLQTKCDTT